MKKLYLHLLASDKKYKTLEDLIEAEEAIEIYVVIDKLDEWNDDTLSRLGGNMIEAVMNEIYPKNKNKKGRKINKLNK